MDAKNVRVRYWAAAAAAAGTRDESLAVEGASRGVTVAGVRAAVLTAHPMMADVLARCSALADGRRLDDDAAVEVGTTVEFLPPFAGG